MIKITLELRIMGGEPALIMECVNGKTSRAMSKAYANFPAKQFTIDTLLADREYMTKMLLDDEASNIPVEN